MSKKNQRGLSLIEAMIGFAIIGTILALMVFGFKKCMAGQSDSAEGQATQFGLQMRLNVLTVSCTDVADKHGYVSCTIGYQKPDGTTAMMPVQCAGRWTTNSGCRMLVMGVHP